MSNLFTAHCAPDDAERHAYNAAFYELGLRWHWDAQTYSRLMQHSPCSKARLRLYLESAQPHLLRAYDAEFLVAAIEQRKATIGGRGAASRSASAANVNWAAMQAGEIGA
jgi:cation transport regulator ChaB